MTYVSKPEGNRLGLYAEKIEKRRQELRLDEKGFPLPRPEPEPYDDDDLYVD